MYTTNSESRRKRLLFNGNVGVPLTHAPVQDEAFEMTVVGICRIWRWVVRCSGDVRFGQGSFRRRFSCQCFHVADVSWIELIDQIWNGCHVIHSFIIHPAIELSTEYLQISWVSFIKVDWKRNHLVMSGGAGFDTFSQIRIAKILPVPNVVRCPKCVIIAVSLWLSKRVKRIRRPFYIPRANYPIHVVAHRLLPPPTVGVTNLPYCGNTIDIADNSVSSLQKWEIIYFIYQWWSLYTRSVY